MSSAIDSLKIGLSAASLRTLRRAHASLAISDRGPACSAAPVDTNQTMGWSGDALAGAVRPRSRLEQGLRKTLQRRTGLGMFSFRVFLSCRLDSRLTDVRNG